MSPCNINLINLGKLSPDTKFERQVPVFAMWGSNWIGLWLHLVAKARQGT